METKPQAQSFPMEEEVVACAEQRVAIAKQCKEVEPGMAVPMEEEGITVACVLRAAIATQCKEVEPDGAVPKSEAEAEEVVACAQGMVMAIAEQCKVMKPNVAVPMEEEVAACDQGAAKAKERIEMESKFAVLKEEEAVACAQSVVIAEPCKEVKPEVGVSMEEEAVACDLQANTKELQRKEMEPKGAVPMEEEIVACDEQVAPDDMVPLPAPAIAKLCKELDPEAVILENDVYLTMEDCSGELPLPANGDGDGDGDGGKSIVDVTTNGSKDVTERGLISEPVTEAPVENREEPEPSWGDVPDEPVTVPVTSEKTPRFPKRQRPAPENVEVDDVVQSMRNILMDLRNADDARLHPDDEAKVRSLLEYHPQAQEKMGSGIDYIKIKRHSIFKEVRCFWVVRTDGTETDFSYHKCLKEKVAKDHPSFVDRYDAVYRTPKKPRQA